MTLDFGPGRKRLSLSTGLDIKKGILWRPKGPSRRFVCLDGIPRTDSALQTLLALPKHKMPQHQNYKQKKNGKVTNGWWFLPDGRPTLSIATVRKKIWSANSFWEHPKLLSYSDADITSLTQLDNGQRHFVQMYNLCTSEPQRGKKTLWRTLGNKLYEDETHSSYG